MVFPIEKERKEIFFFFQNKILNIYTETFHITKYTYKKFYALYKVDTKIWTKTIFFISFILE